PVLLACVQPCRRAHRILVPHLLSFPFPLARPPPTSPLFPYTTLFRSIQTTAEITKWYMVHTRNRTCFHFFIFAHINHMQGVTLLDRKSTRLNSSHVSISYAVSCLKKKNEDETVDKIRKRQTALTHGQV